MNPFDFQIQLAFISLDDEANLLDEIKTAMKNKLAHPGPGRSRIIRYGWDYLSDDHHGNPPVWLPVIPDADSWTINEYPIGHTIAPHIDSLKFDDAIRVLSLGAETGMVFISPMGQEIVRELPRRSLATFSGELRRSWKHSTLPTSEPISDNQRRLVSAMESVRN